MACLSIVIAAPATPFDLVRPSSLGRLETKNGRFVSLACPALQIERPELESEPTTTTTPYPPLDNPSLQEGGGCISTSPSIIARAARRRSGQARDLIACILIARAIGLARCLPRVPARGDGAFPPLSLRSSWATNQTNMSLTTSESSIHSIHPHLLDYICRIDWQTGFPALLLCCEHVTAGRGLWIDRQS